MSDLAAAYQAAPGQVSEDDINRPTASTSSLKGIKGPKEVYRERMSRLAKRQAETEQKDKLERIRAAEEAILLDERRKSIERKKAAASGETHDGFAQTSSRVGNHSASPRDLPMKTREGSRSRNVSVPGRELLHGKTIEVQPGLGDESRGSRSRSRPPENQTKTSPSSYPSHTPSHPPPRLTATASVTRSSFPHAFERWETLSAHWEGLTSFWIHRLEENRNNIDRDSLLQQLSRQVTDLSAAGANLFHAVVELQRLRASSERKFQRWFFEARTEQERHKEIQATIDRKLRAESVARAEAVEEAATRERERLTSEKKLVEIKRELQISKEEAKRAWEELGRREQEERIRTASLRDGLPTLIGGVQVVPMISGVPNRSIITPRAYYPGPPPPELSGDDDGPSDIVNTYEDYSRNISETPGTYFEAHRSPNPQDPSVSDQDGLSRQASRNMASHQQAETKLHDTSEFYPQFEETSRRPSDSRTYKPFRAEENYSDVEKEQGEYKTDDPDQYNAGNQVQEHGNPMGEDYQSETSVPEHYPDDNPGLTQYVHVPEVEYSRSNLPPMTYTNMSGSDSASNQGSDTADLLEFSRQGYTPVPNWPVVPRHHHPTRLSDVMEEDEKSRTSASQISRSRE